MNTLAMTKLQSMQQRIIAVDALLLAVSITLILIGFIAMSSASVEYAAEKYGDPFYHAVRHFFHLCIALAVAVMAYQLPMALWEKLSPLLLFLGLTLLVLVLIPGVGREVNGSQRWLPLGVMTLQCSEVAKLSVIMYLAGYLVRRQAEVRQSWSGFVKPMLVLFAVTLLLMLEPDFGATVVTAGTALGMLFLAGVKLGQFILVILSALMALALMVYIEPYRMQRMVTFLDPWAEQFAGGYQLTQSLIAFGRGEWLGVGLGNSVQKLFYLPEAHTDFVFAIFAEEFGLVGALCVMALFAVMIGRILYIARLAETRQQFFNAYVAYGIALMLSAQVFINMGVNMGLLPTKGLTLPFLSYGGSSLLLCCVAIAIILRIAHETGEAEVRR